MNEILADTKAVLLWLLASIGTLLGVLGAIVMSMLRGQIKRIDKLEAEMVRRTEFNELRTYWQAQHVENVGRIDTGFSRIETLMREDRKQTDDHREKLRTSLDDLRTEVAVLKAEGPFDDAGRLRR